MHEGRDGTRTAYEMEVHLRHAEEEKRREYDASVRTLAFDPRGRLNQAGVAALADLACAVAAGKGRSWCTSPHRLALRWRARLERALLWNEATNAIKSWGRVEGDSNPGDDWRKMRGVPTGGAGPTRNAAAEKKATAPDSGKRRKPQSGEVSHSAATSEGVGAVAAPGRAGRPR